MESLKDIQAPKDGSFEAVKQAEVSTETTLKQSKVIEATSIVHTEFKTRHFESTDPNYGIALNEDICLTAFSRWFSSREASIEQPSRDPNNLR